MSLVLRSGSSYLALRPPPARRRCGSAEGLDAGRHCLRKWGFRRCEDIVWIKTNKDPTIKSVAATCADPNAVLQHTKVGGWDAQPAGRLRAGVGLSNPLLSLGLMDSNPSSLPCHRPRRSIA